MTVFSSPRTLRLSAAATFLSVFAVAGCHRDPNVRKRKYLESGQRYEKEGKYREATLQFYNALKADKNFAPAHYELAKTLLKQNMALQAFPELVTTVSLAPDNAQARVDLGSLYLAARETDKAEEQAKAALKLQPNNTDALSLMAGVDAARGNRQGAIDILNQAIAAEPNRSELHTNLAVMKGVGGKDLPGARQELEKAISIDPKNARAHLALADLLEVQNDLPGAERELKAAVSADPQNLQARTALAALFLREKNVGEAEKVLQQASDDFADNTDGAGILERFYERSGQFPKAEPAYAALAAKHPKSFPIQMAYARILAAGGKFDKANAIAAKELDAHGKEPQFIQLKAGLLLHDGKGDDAMKLLQSGVRDNPENADLKQQLGFVARDRGDLPTAAANLRAALQLNPRNMLAAAGLADVVNRQGDRAALRQLADNMQKQYPNTPAPLIWKATADAGDGHLDSAVENLQAALKMDPKNAQALSELGEVRVQQGKTAEGKALLQQALAINPNSAALPVLVQVNMRTGQPAVALSLLQSQLAQNPNNVSVLLQMAEVQLATKDVHGAEDSANKALKLAPGNKAVMQVYTQASLAANDLSGPTELWQNWAGSHPQDAQAQAFLGTLAESAGDKSKAITYYQRSLQLQADQPIVQNNLAFLMADSGGNTDVALTLAQAAQRANPNSPDIQDTLAWVYYKKGVYGSALDLLQTAAKNSPDNASVFYHMGMVYEKMNNKAAAQTSLKKAAGLPNAEVAKKAQAELDHLG